MLINLNKLWIEYDAIAKKWGVYKVETIGDAYLAVTGCPQRSTDHAARAANFALGKNLMLNHNRYYSHGEKIQDN